MTRNSSNRTPDAGQKTNSGRKWTKILLGSLLTVAVCATVRYYWNAAPANADSSQRPGTSLTVRSADETAREPSQTGRPAKPTTPEIVGTVNTQRITREELGRECLRHFGTEVLESMVNKRLIERECRQRGITVTSQEVTDEIRSMAEKFRIPVDQWMKMIKQERNIEPEQYANDIVWPTIALRKLAGDQLTVTDEELRTEFETRYGESVRVRLIAVKDREKAEKLHTMAVANPQDFGNIAKEHSEDATSASVKGVINPIRRHGSYEEIEKAAFTMDDGEISPVIHVGGQYVMIKREKLIEAQRVKLTSTLADGLKKIIRERKMRDIAQTLFQKLQEAAVKQKAIENVWNDPAKRARMPGVAARIYDEQITIRELAEECIDRHGPQVLEGVISRKVIELACKQRNIEVTDADIDEEIAHAAAAGGSTTRDGKPDVKAWLEFIAKKQGVSLEVYRNDAIWPSVALKKLAMTDKNANKSLEVSDEDLQKGYEANYGPRVRCLAIVLNEQRRAQQVWEMARKDNTSEYFGQLAEQFSVEAGTRELKGEIPPIKRHGGQPTIEKEAFDLKPGELSSVIQVEDKFIILRCEGYTKPIGVDLAKVSEEIRSDLYEKKLRRTMADCFANLQESATIDNYLAGTSQSPKKSTARAPALRQAPSR